MSLCTTRGCGLRSDAYLNQLRPEFGKSIEIVAFADPDKAATDAYIACYGNGKPIKTALPVNG